MGMQRRISVISRSEEKEVGTRETDIKTLPYVFDIDNISYIYRTNDILYI